MTREDLLCNSMFMMKGLDNQLDMLVEECSELILAVAKYKRGVGSFEDVLKESTDVSIVNRQIELNFNESFCRNKNEKLDKFEKYVVKENCNIDKLGITYNKSIIAKVRGFMDIVELFVDNEGRWCLTEHYGNFVNSEDVLYWAYK